MKKEYNLFSELGFLIGHTGRALKNSMTKAFADNEFEVTSEQWGILMLLWSKEGITQQEISSAISKEKTTVVRLIDNMEKRKIIRRQQDKGDRRNNLIYLTGEGKKLREKLVPIAISELRKALNNLNEKEVETLTYLLQKVYDNLKNNKHI
ncbi:MAG: MarR family transcriptional regulator [Bacteroidetes bacterium]|nr:MAG: MarR family transcriptional regulator [Bacteroidota bacterium]